LKRSVAVGLTIAAGAAAWYALAPSARDEEIAGNLYTDPQSCAADGRYTRDQCITAAVNANEAHQQSAPRYATQADCLADFPGSTCQPLYQTGGGPSLFVPAMAGFVVAATVASAMSAPSAVPVYRTCRNDADPQACRSGGSVGGGAYYTGSGSAVSRGSSGSSVSLARSGFTSAPSTATLSRGGFGARAAAHGGGHS